MEQVCSCGVERIRHNDLSPAPETCVPNHAWREEWGTSRPWSGYPMGLRCSGCGMGLDRHPVQPGHVLPNGSYDSALA